jgi:hypothetical protein
VRRRRLAALVAAAALLVLFLLQNRVGELRRRVFFLQHSASRELAVRRLAGSGSAMDRKYFFFLESARRKLPAGTRGVAIYVNPPTKPALYIASYALAPIPVVLSPRRVPPRWIAAVYGAERPAGWRLLETVPGGALLAPP